MLSGVMRGERPPRGRIYLTPPETLGIFEEGGTLFREGVYAAPALSADGVDTPIVEFMILEPVYEIENP